VSADGFENAFIESRDGIRPTTGTSLTEIVFKEVMYLDGERVLTECREAATRG
jgi:hypothetical protein